MDGRLLCLLAVVSTHGKLKRDKNSLRADLFKCCQTLQTSAFLWHNLSVHPLLSLILGEFFQQLQHSLLGCRCDNYLVFLLLEVRLFWDSELVKSKKYHAYVYINKNVSVKPCYFIGDWSWCHISRTICKTVDSIGDTPQDRTAWIQL